MQSDAFLPDLQRALAGRYVLERRLGQGGMGVVYLAREVRLERRVALKLLAPERAFRADARERFLREARTAARLSHPGIVPIFAVDEVREFVFFAMAYVEGQTLGQRVRGEGPLPYPAAARLLQEVARALHYAHGRGVVHRDVQPDNIMLERATGRAVVSDFGIARVDGNRHTGPREVRGTAQFMSPEQATGGAVDARSDLYSLGIVGFYAVSGRLPFDGPDAMAVLARQVTDPPPPVASVAPGIPEPLAEAIDRCLAKDPAARYPSGEAFANALPDPGERRTAVALRAFVREAQRLSTTTLISTACAVIAFSVLALHVVEVDDPRVRAAMLAVAVSLVTIPAAITLARVRRLVRAGFERRDLLEALRADLSHYREELAFLFGEGPSRVERVARHACHAALVVAAGIVAAVVRAPTLAGRTVVPLAWGAAAGVALLAALVARMRTEYRTDPKAERRLRFWRGPLGRWLFALGQRARPRRPTPAAARGVTPVPDEGG